MIELPDKKKCFTLPEQVAQNLRNITFLAEQYKNIDALPAVWQVYKEEFDSEMETFEGWTTTFEGWDTTLSTYLANMSSAAVSAIAGQNIAPSNVAATGNITAASIIENMSGYTFDLGTGTENLDREVIYAGAVKNGNKLTLVVALNVTRTDTLGGTMGLTIGEFFIPQAVLNKLIPTLIGGYNFLDARNLSLSSSHLANKTFPAYSSKPYGDSRQAGYVGYL